MAKDESTIYEDLLAGPDAVRELETASGKKFYARSGTRGQRNSIESAFQDSTKYMDAVLKCVYFQLANPDGTQHHADKSQKELAAVANYDAALEIVLAIRGDEDENGEGDEDTLDEKTAEMLGNSKSQSGST